MKVGLAVFAYNRSVHLAKTLEGLKQNQRADRLYIFHDGLKCEEHREEWEKTRKVIENVDWCDTTTIYSERNKGLAVSIVDGINKVLEDNDAVIVLEDDCVPHPKFISFMYQCFEKYQNDQEVYCVSGYSWPIDIPQGDSDIYFCGRVSSWGWGTWKNRWEKYNQDYTAISRLKQNKDSSRRLAAWGKDLEDILVCNIKGESNSWAVFWALNVIENQGMCINPYHSLIQNIGLDGSGVHCGISEQFQVDMDERNVRLFKFPNNIRILDNTEEAFKALHGSVAVDTEVNNFQKHKETKVLIYGLGKFYHENEEAICTEYEIVAYVDKRKSGCYAGKEIIFPKDINKQKFEKVIIMVQNIQESMNIARYLRDEVSIEVSKVTLGIEKYGEYAKHFEKIAITPDGDIEVVVRGIKLRVASLNEFNNIYEVMVKRIYHYAINNGKKNVVIDIGMNTSESTLYFMENPEVEKIYAYEPCYQTYKRAKKNLERNQIDSKRVQIYNYGISNKYETRIVSHHCLIQKGETEQIVVKNAAEIFLEIIQQHRESNIVVKMDCEGEECGIIDKLSEAGLISKIKFIMLEWHYKGKEPILECLKENGFVYWCSEKSKDMGLIYAVNGGI